MLWIVILQLNIWRAEPLDSLKDIRMWGCDVDYIGSVAHEP